MTVSLLQCIVNAGKTAAVLLEVGASGGEGPAVARIQVIEIRRRGPTWKP